MTTAAFHRVQIVDSYFDLLWNFMRAVLMRMPGTLRRQIGDAQLQTRFLQIRHTAETLVVDASSRKHLLLVGGRRFVTRLILAALIWG
jgi:hypothetical protein